MLLFKHKPSRTFPDEVEWPPPNKKKIGDIPPGTTVSHHKIVISQPWKKGLTGSNAAVVVAAAGVCGCGRLRFLAVLRDLYDWYCAQATNVIQKNQVRIATLVDLLGYNISPYPICQHVGTMVITSQFTKPTRQKLRKTKGRQLAATIGAVEASKDQLGLCRWNYMIRSVNQRIRNNVRSAAQANRFSSSSTIPLASCKDCDKAKQAEESLRTVMYLSCWGLN
ncbi:hypothetical protein YC2023_076437 [Brassica napus]